MSVPAAYLGIIIIWATTPLAIKWSGEGVGFLFGVSARMFIGALVCSMIMLLLSRRLPLHRKALKSYMAAGLAIYGAMTCVYWGAQYIPSGLISVIFGLTPIFTGILAAIYLNENSLTPVKLFGLASGLTGLVMIFGLGVELNESAGYGIAAVFVAMLIHSISTVWVKSISAHLTALELVNGGLLVSVPLYLITWLVFDGHLPQSISEQTAVSIFYLAIFGSVFGFIMFFYVLKHVEVGRVALVTLITPVLALFIGQGLNQESIEPAVWIGTACILFGMSLYQWGEQFYRSERDTT